MSGGQSCGKTCLSQTLPANVSVQFDKLHSAAA